MRLVLHVELNMMMKMMIGGKLQEPSTRSPRASPWR